jgi:hypothetical protein
MLENYLVCIILVEICGGIIIDMFCNLREKANERAEDRSDICFVCGVSQDDFDRKTDSEYTFEYHTLVYF